MSETRLPRERAGRALVGRTYRAELRRLDGLLRFALEVLRSGRLTIGNKRGLDAVVVRVVLALYVKACKTARAVRIQAASGLPEDTLVVARTLFETAIAVLFILQKNSRRRAQMFLAHIAVHADKAFNTWKQTPGLRRGVTKAMRRMVDDQLRDYENALGSAVMESLRKNGYSGMRIEPTAVSIGERRAYQVFYRYASTAAHVSDLSEHMDFAADGTLILKLPPSATPPVRIALVMAYSSLWVILNRVDARLGLGQAHEIKTRRPTARVP